MYHTWVVNENFQNLNDLFSLVIVTFKDLQNYLNYLEKIQPYNFWLEEPIKEPNQQ